MYTFKKLDRPAAGAGAPSIGAKFAYLALVDDLVSFPDTDENNVRLLGEPVFKDGKGLTPVYMTSSTKAITSEVQGDEDAESFKLKFVAAHPGSELEALEFVRNMMGKDFIIFIPGCKTSDPVTVMGRPCEPLKFKSSHKSDKDGKKFEFTFEQPVGGQNTYMLYFGSLRTLETAYAEVDFATALTTLSNVQKVEATGTASPLNITSLDGLTEKQVTFIGQEADPSKAGTIAEDLTGPVIILLKDGVQWKAVENATISFEVYPTSAGVALIERWRT